VVAYFLPIYNYYNITALLVYFTDKGDRMLSHTKYGVKKKKQLSDVTKQLVK